jgi:hypothetical protein
MLPHRAVRELSIVLVAFATIWTGLPAAVISGSVEPIDTVRVFVTLCVMAAFTVRTIWRRRVEPEGSVDARAPLQKIRSAGALQTYR